MFRSYGSKGMRDDLSVSFFVLETIGSSPHPLNRTKKGISTKLKYLGILNLNATIKKFKYNSYIRFKNTDGASL